MRAFFRTIERLKRLFDHNVEYVISKDAAQVLSKALTTLEPGDTLRFEAKNLVVNITLSRLRVVTKEAREEPEEYRELMKKAPAQESPEFMDFLRQNNDVLLESDEWLVIKNFKYGWPTAFAKVSVPSFQFLLDTYPDHEMKLKRKSRRTIRGRLHVHLIPDDETYLRNN